MASEDALPEPGPGPIPTPAPGATGSSARASSRGPGTESDQTLRMTEPHPDAASGSPADAVLLALRKLVKPASPEEVAQATGLSEATVRRTLGRLVSVRDAKRAGGGRYTAARAR
jgi:anaerobic selenocysteine-containing dehydrogenase